MVHNGVRVLFFIKVHFMKEFCFLLETLVVCIELFVIVFGSICLGFRFWQQPFDKNLCFVLTFEKNLLTQRPTNKKFQLSTN